LDYFNRFKSIFTNVNWKTAKKAPEGWQLTDFDDSKWVNAAQMGIPLAGQPQFSKGNKATVKEF